MQTFCKSVDIFQKICKGFSRICPALGHEIEENIISFGTPFSSHMMTAPVTNTIAISMTQSGVIITAGGSVSGVAGSASAGSNGSVSGVAGSASAGSVGSVSGVASSASAAGVASSASAGSVGSVSGIIASASAGVMSMTWPSIVTSAFGSMIATISPSAHSHILRSSFAHSGQPWWSSYNISERMEWWLHYIKNNTDCKHGEKFCGLKLKCIPDDEKCTVHLTNNMMYNLSNTAWCVNCSSNEYFCPLFMQCIGVNESCSYHRVHKWINSGNKSDGLDFDMACRLNETFSFVTMKCESKGPQGSKEHICPHNEGLCPYSASCRNKTDCDRPPALNFSKALDNDTFGKNDTLVYL